jgi:secreted PhoX family phosphatase
VPLAGGGLVPNAFDGMGAFAAGSGLVRLVRNHELRDIPSGGAAPFGHNAYDAKGPAGTTTLEVSVHPSGSAEVLNSPDNICVRPRGGLVLCEDGSSTNYVRGLTREGEIFDLVRNDLNDSEWAGACFSPPGRTLFVNIQGNTRPLEQPSAARAMTFAIWGPWESGAL